MAKLGKVLIVLFVLVVGIGFIYVMNYALEIALEPGAAEQLALDEVEQAGFGSFDWKLEHGNVDPFRSRYWYIFINEKKNQRIDVRVSEVDGQLQATMQGPKQDREPRDEQWEREKQASR